MCLCGSPETLSTAQLGGRAVVEGHRQQEGSGKLSALSMGWCTNSMQCVGMPFSVFIMRAVAYEEEWEMLRKYSLEKTIAKVQCDMNIQLKSK